MRFKTEIKFAVLSATLLTAWTLLAWKLGWHDTDFTLAQHGKKVAATVSILCVWLAVRERRQRQGGFINFGEGFRTGVIVGVIAAFLNGAFLSYYSRVLNPGWLQRGWEWQKAGLIASGAKEADLGRPEAIATASQKLLYQLLLDPIGKIMVGIILATAVAGLLRRKREEETKSGSTAPPSAR